MQAVGNILPFAIAVAFSGVPIMATILILLSPNRKRSGLPFLIGWLVGLFVVVVLSALAAQAVPTSRSPRQPDTVVGWIEIVLGLALIALTLFTLRRARRRKEMAIPKWLESAGSLGPWSALGLALVLNIRPKALLLAVAAGLTVRADASDLSDALIAIVVYTVIAGSTVAVPIVGTLLAPEKMEPRLVGTRTWLGRNGEALGSIIGIVIGVVIVGMGMARL
ncbi:GAP family protein [Microbacterium terricola]|uniref:Membrane protein n=1 Tax=Microbacterium terricola TaxID=344163 RepID=A0ABM8E0D2_9MICO|nr:GAP family protein [Microbacterium terricola]UYK40997.1 GAP family protein [Microbacterium terricola]BDV31246.1 membrane protein [Microbacterium terricola]